MGRGKGASGVDGGYGEDFHVAVALALARADGGGDGEKVLGEFRCELVDGEVGGVAFEARADAPDPVMLITGVVRELRRVAAIRRDPKAGGNMDDAEHPVVEPVVAGIEELHD